MIGILLGSVGLLCPMLLSINPITIKEPYISGRMLYAVSSAYFFNIQHCFSYLQRYKTAKKIHFRWSSRPNGLASRWRLPRRHGITGWSVNLFEGRRQAFKRKNLPQNSLWENVLHNKIKRLINVATL